MFTFLTIAGIWIGGMVAFSLWDAYVGFGVEFDGCGWPPMFIAVPFWFLAGPAAIIRGLFSRLEKVKDVRLAKAEQQKRIRIAAEKEQEALMAQIEREMLEDESLWRKPQSLQKNKQLR
jgi:hypothetical protein